MKSKLKNRLTSAISIILSILLIPAALIYIFIWGAFVFGRMITAHMFSKRRFGSVESINGIDCTEHQYDC